MEGGLAAARLEAPRRAFDPMTADPEFKAEFERARVELNPLAGEKLQKLAEELVGISPELDAEVKANFGG